VEDIVNNVFKFHKIEVAKERPKRAVQLANI